MERVSDGQLNPPDKASSVEIPFIKIYTDRLKNSIVNNCANRDGHGFSASFYYESIFIIK